MARLYTALYNVAGERIGDIEGHPADLSEDEFYSRAALKIDRPGDLFVAAIGPPASALPRDGGPEWMLVMYSTRSPAVSKK